MRKIDCQVKCEKIIITVENGEMQIKITRLCCEHSCRSQWFLPSFPGNHVKATRKLKKSLKTPFSVKRRDR